ncbi:MAG: Gfo/Idh/MocA family oxidoreductase [Candidatus Abyssubacteria bacterium]
MKKLRAGVTGVEFAGMVHIEAIRRSGVGEVIAIAGPVEDDVRERAAQLGIDRVYGQYMDLVKDPDIDVVHNCAPNNMHFPISRAALAANKHVVSEKPMAVDSREARLLLNAADRSKSVSALVLNYRHYPVMEQARSVIASGELGKILCIHGNYLQDRFLYETDYDWSVDAAQGGVSRALADLGMHWCDLVQFLTGLKVVEVAADLRTFIPVRKRSVTTVATFGKAVTPRHVNVRVSTEDYASVLLHFNGGVSGALTVSQMSAGRKNQLFVQIDGTEKSMAWNQEQPEILWIGRRDKPNETLAHKLAPTSERGKSALELPPGYGEAWLDSITNFMRLVYQQMLNGKKPGRDADFATFADGYRMAVLVDKMLTSNRQRRWLKLNLK